MRKRIVLIVVPLVLCLMLVGYGVITTKDSYSKKNDNQASNSTLSKKIITGGARSAGSRFKMDLDKLTINYDKIDGYDVDGNSIELYVMLKKELSLDEKIDTHNKLVDYFKTITDDGKIYNLYADEEYDKSDTESTGVYVRGKIEGKEYKIFFGGYVPRESYPESYRITINLNS